MKYYLILLIVLLNLFEDTINQEVVNSCGSDEYKATNNMPKS